MFKEVKFFAVAVECAVARDSQGRAIFNHVKIALGKISRTLPRNFNALLTTSPHRIPARCEKFFAGRVAGDH
jgi:hypothetical protein